MQFLRSKRTPGVAVVPSDLLGSVSSGSVMTQSMIRAATLDPSECLGSQLSAGSSENLHLSWMALIGEVCLTSFLGHLKLDIGVISDYFAETPESLQQGLYYSNYQELKSRSLFSAATLARLDALPILLSPRASFVPAAMLKEAIKLELRSRLSLLYPFVRRSEVPDDKVFRMLVFVRNRLRRIFLSNSMTQLEEIFERHALLSFSTCVRTRLEIDLTGGILSDYHLSLDHVRYVFLSI